MNSKKESLNIVFIYETKTNIFDFDLLKNDLKKIDEETGCKITLYEIEISELEEKLKTIPNVDMVCSQPGEAIYIPKVLEKFPNVTWVHSMFAGVDKYLKVPELMDQRIILTNARGAYAGPLAEYTMMAILYFNYNVPNYINLFDQKNWKRLTNEMIENKTLLIIGYGQNGLAIGKKAKLGFDMKVIGVVRTMRDNIEGKEYCDKLIGFNELNKDIISQADFILTTLPQTKESVNYFDKKFFESMKKTAVFINIGRGSAVVEDDLIEALNNGTIRAAMLDVTQREPMPKDDKLYLVDKTKLLITTHSGDLTTDYVPQCYKVLYDNIKSYIKDGSLKTIVRKELGY
ncbi:MAG: D-2-hydroxyacid dehydrogenase [archaeon]|nr:D-2-hydroxyacid dehydrogenase [archaeon]